MEEIQKAVVEGLQEASVPEAKPGKVFQFTQEANRRVKKSYHEDELRQVTFHGRTGVDLKEVELAILAIDKRKGSRHGLAVDEEFGSSLVDCNVDSEDVCVKKFLPTQWEGKSNKYMAGCFTPDLAVPGEDDAPLAVCYLCRQAINAEFAHENRRIGERNKKLLEAGEEPKPLLPFPRYMSLRDAEEAYSRKVAAIKRRHEQQAVAYERREQGAARRQDLMNRMRSSAQAIAWAKNRYNR